MPLFYFVFDRNSSPGEDAALDFSTPAEATAAAARALCEQARDSLITGAANRNITIEVLDAQKSVVARTRLVLEVEVRP